MDWPSLDQIGSFLNKSGAVVDAITTDAKGDPVGTTATTQPVTPADPALSAVSNTPSPSEPFYRDPVAVRNIALIGGGALVLIVVAVILMRR